MRGAVVRGLHRVKRQEKRRQGEREARASVLRTPASGFGLSALGQEAEPRLRGPALCRTSAAREIRRQGACSTRPLAVRARGEYRAAECDRVSGGRSESEGPPFIIAHAVALPPSLRTRSLAASATARTRIHSSRCRACPAAPNRTCRAADRSCRFRSC